MEAEFEREEAAAAAARSGDALAGADPDGVAAGEDAPEAGPDAPVADDATVVADLEASSDRSDTAEEAVATEGDVASEPGDEPVADAETFTEVEGAGDAPDEDSAQTDEPTV